MSYYFCQLCNKFTCDANTHISSSVHISLENMCQNKEYTRGEIVVEISRKMYKFLMDIDCIESAQARTISTLELSKNLTRPNPVVDIISELKKNKQSKWKSIVGNSTLETSCRP